jgi:hypothetical protein
VTFRGLEITVLLTPAFRASAGLVGGAEEAELECDGPCRVILLLIGMHQDMDPACFVPEQREANMAGLWDRYIFWEE